MDTEQILVTRFLYLQSYGPNFNNRRLDMSLKTITPVHINLGEHLKKLAESDPKAPFNVIRKALQSKTLSRNNETWFAVCTLLRHLDNKEAKSEIYDHLHELVVSPEDLLLFVYYYKSLKDDNNGFGGGMRKFLKKWYLSKSPNELVDMFATQKSLMGTSHRSILAYARFKIEDPEKNKIFNYLFAHGNKIVADENSTAAYKKLCQYHQLKRAKTADEVIEILKKKEIDYKIEHLPSFALVSIAVWEVMLPTMNTRNILDSLPKFQSHKMLKNEAFSKRVANVLGNYKFKEKLNPLFVFFALRDYEYRCHRQDYSNKLEDEKKKEENPENGAASNACSHDEKKESKELNTFIVKRIYSVLNITFSHNPKSGVRYFITIDFRKFSKNNSKLVNNTQVKCAEAQLLLALTLLKSEKDVTLMSFTADAADKLKPIEFTKETSYEKAMEYYQNEIKTTPKTKQNLCTPITTAKGLKKKVDLFITVVDSASRTLGGIGTPKNKPIDALKDYRKFMNLKMAKYVIINLSKGEPLFTSEDVSQTSKGFLEVCGLGPDTLSIIEAFAKNSFV